MKDWLDEKLVRCANGGDCACRCGRSRLDRRDRENGLRLAPIVVALRHHHVKTPVPSFFLGFDQSKGIQVEQITFDKNQLLLRQAAALKVDGDTGKMRRRRVSINRSGVAIVAAQLL